MSQVSAPRSRAASPPAHGRPPPWRSAAIWTAGAAAMLLGLFLGHTILEGHRLPLGPDGPVYVWWTEFAGAAGLDAVRRPGFPGLALVLGTLLASDPATIVAALEPVLAVVAGLAGAAFIDAALGEDRARAAIAAVIVGAFSAFLAPGWLANLSMAGLFLAALAGFALADRSWRPAGLGAACLAAGGLTHPLFLALGIAVLIGGLVFLAPGTLRRLRAGEPFWSIGTIRVAGAVGAGTGLTLVGLAAFSGGTSAPGDSSQDQFFRRLGLRGFLRDRLHDRLTRDLRRVRLTAWAGVALGALLPLVRRPRSAGWRFLLAVIASWTLITAVGVIVLSRTDQAPAARLLTFAFFLPLLGAPVATAAVRARDWRTPVAAAALAAMVWGGMAEWYRQAPFVEERELQAVGEAVAVAETLPPDAPLIFLVDTTEFASAFHVSRFANVIRAGLPGERIDDAWFVVGSPADLRARRVGTGNGDPEYRAISRAYLEEARPVLDEAAVFVLRPFNGPGFAAAQREGTTVGSDAALLQAPEEATPAPSSQAADRPGSSPWTVALVAVGAVALLGALGGGWARWTLVGGAWTVVLGAAPAVGAAVAIAGALVADRLALAAAPAGTAIAGLLGALGYVLAVRTRHQAVDGPEDR